MTTFQAVILGIVQGLTEFLPISSSGHLVLGKALFGLEEPDVFFDIVLHVGTLLAILTFYRRDLRELAADLFTPRVPGTGWFSAENWRESSGRGFALLVLAGTLPTGLIGLRFKDSFEAAFSSLWTVGLMLLLSGALVASTRLTRPKAVGSLSPLKALLIGTAQGLAILPGLSRSGTTLAVAFFLKITPAQAVRFSFLLSVPAIVGALLLKLREVDLAGLEAGPLLAGFGASALTGYLALWLLVRLVLRGHLHWFALWCLFAAGTAFLKATL